jgi:hypothetical protein
MGWSMILKSFLLLSVKQRVQQVSPDDVYGKAIYLPIVNVLMNTPGTFFLLALGLLTSAAVVQFYPQYFFPTDFVLTLAGVALLGSGASYLVYQRILKQVLWDEARPPVEVKVQRALDALKAQFVLEQHGLVAAIKGKKTGTQLLSEHVH